MTYIYSDTLFSGKKVSGKTYTVESISFLQ